MNKNNESKKLCACGCGLPVKSNRKFVHGHNNRGKPSPLKTLPSTPPPFCDCGCGKVVLWGASRRRWNKYIKGHEHKGRTHSPESIAKMREKAKNRADHVAEMNKQRVWTAESRKKISAAKKRNPAPMQFSNGPENPRYKKGKPYLRPSSSILIRLRQELIEARGFNCEQCKIPPAKEELLHMHHRNDDPFNNDATNLLLLCVTCHNRVTHNY